MIARSGLFDRPDSHDCPLSGEDDDAFAFRLLNEGTENRVNGEIFEGVLSPEVKTCLRTITDLLCVQLVSAGIELKEDEITNLGCEVICSLTEMPGEFSQRTIPEINDVIRTKIAFLTIA